MFRSLLKSLKVGQTGANAGPPGLPGVADDARAMLFTSEGFPHVDWDIAGPWIEKHGQDAQQQWLLVRAIGRAWMDALCAVLEQPHAGFRTERVEGLGPTSDIARLVSACTRAVRVVERALVPILGTDPATPLGVIALANEDLYLGVTAHFHPPEGEWATSGGIYLRGESSILPTLVLPMHHRHAVETTVAHEFTHHALSSLQLPLWAEEGLTQMMEERMSGGCQFVVNREMLARHRRRWRDDGLEAFWTGVSFSSPHEDTAELSYHLAQFMVRSLLDQNSKAFFAFARGAKREDEGRAAAAEHLGVPELNDLAWRMLRPSR